MGKHAGSKYVADGSAEADPLKNFLRPDFPPPTLHLSLAAQFVPLFGPPPGVFPFTGDTQYILF